MAGRYAVVVSPRAEIELERMVDEYPIPASTRARLREGLRDLERFPNMGRNLPPGKYGGHQILFGPYAWMASIYRVDGNTVRVVSIEDCRRADAASGY